MRSGPIHDYVQKLGMELRALPPLTRGEWLRDARTHLEDAAEASTGGGRYEQETEAVRNFGAPADVARAMLAESYLEASTEGLRPAAAARGVLYALASDTAWIACGLVVSIAYVALLLLAIASVAKWWLPDAGLWLHDGGGWSLSLHGFSDAREILGAVLPFYGPVLCLAGWWAINQVLRSVLRLFTSRHLAAFKREPALRH